MNHEEIFKYVIISIGIPVLSGIGASYVYDFVEHGGIQSYDALISVSGFLFSRMEYRMMWEKEEHPSLSLIKLGNFFSNSNSKGSQTKNRYTYFFFRHRSGHHRIYHHVILLADRLLLHHDGGSGQRRNQEKHSLQGPYLWLLLLSTRSSKLLIQGVLPNPGTVDDVRHPYGSHLGQHCSARVAGTEQGRCRLLESCAEDALVCQWDGMVHREEGWE